MVTPTPPRTEPDHMARGGLDTNCGPLHLRFKPCLFFEGSVIRNENRQRKLVIEKLMSTSKKFQEFKKNFVFTLAGKVANYLCSSISLKTAERSEAKGAKQRFASKYLLFEFLTRSFASRSWLRVLGFASLSNF